MLYLRKSVLFVLCAIILIASSAEAQDVVIIASPDVSVGSVSAGDIQNIFLGKKTTWDDGSKITFITLTDGDTHQAFLKNYVRKSSAQYKNYWKKQVFTGKGRMPDSVASDQEMVEAISGATKAIGYVSAGVDLGNTKKLAVK